MSVNQSLNAEETRLTEVVSQKDSLCAVTNHQLNVKNNLLCISPIFNCAIVLNGAEHYDLLFVTLQLYMLSMCTGPWEKFCVCFSVLMSLASIMVS